VSALIAQLENAELKNALTQTRDKVNEGSSLADALRAHPAIFQALYVNMVAAGEASGTLETVLGRLADFLESQTKLKNKVTAALAYPAFMSLMSLVTVAIMMIVVVPKVTSIFDDFQQALPWYTRLLIFTSDVFTGYWWLLLMLGGGAAYAFRRWLATPAGRARPQGGGSAPRSASRRASFGGGATWGRAGSG
jgi:general secretion pathway protein F